MTHQITTSLDLIKLLGEKLYSSRLDAILARELLQNAIDASDNTKICIDMSWDSNDVFTIDVDDIGCGMDENVLLNIFLSIGSSYKANTKNPTGGFGIAKVALFATDHWYVHTNDNYIDSYLEFKKIERRTGTHVHARIKFNSAYNWEKNHVERIVKSNTYPNLFLNGNHLQPFMPSKTLANLVTENGIPYTFSITTEHVKLDGNWLENDYGYVYYRIHGLTQFVQYGNAALRDSNRNLIIDFQDIGYKPVDDSYPFTLSRETITDKGVAGNVNDWLSELSKDVQSKIRQAEENKDNKTEWINERTGLIARSDNGKLYKPSLFDRRVANVWKQIVTIIADDVDWKIAVIDYDRVKAFYQHSVDGQHIIGINPKIFASDLRLELRYKLTEPILMYLWHMACHEITHYHCGAHDENFTIQENHIALHSVYAIDENVHEIKRLIRKLYD